jgi:hypothetical protein
MQTNNGTTRNESTNIKMYRTTEIERGSTRSHPMENSLWKRLRTCRKTDCRMNEQKYSCACCLYWCETCYLTLREDSRLNMFKNKVPRKIFGPKGEVTGDWRTLPNEELNGSYPSPRIIRVMKSGRIR